MMSTEERSNRRWICEERFSLGVAQGSPPPLGSIGTAHGRACREAEARRGAGFTLVDLLVVIGLVALSAVLVALPFSSHARHQAREAACALNLKRISVALSTCTDDNNGWLPPGAGATEGLTMGQACGYRATPAHQARLVYYLAPYLGYPPAGASNRLVKTFLCPVIGEAGEGLTNLAEQVSYGVPVAGLGTVGGGPGLPFNPFGYPAAAGAPLPPHRLAELQSCRSLSEVWALLDVDRDSFSGFNGAWLDSLPSSPAHVWTRNYLFFDGHVATKPIAAKGQL